MSDDQKKKALKAAIKKELRPLMRELGFTPDKRPFEERNLAKIGLYVRHRAEYVDELQVLWLNYGRPVFMIEFWTDQSERIRWLNKGYPPQIADRMSGRIYPRRKRRFNPFDSEPWYGREKTIDETMQIAKARLVDVDSYLRTGEPTTYLTWC